MLDRMRASGMTLVVTAHGEPSESGLVAVTAQRLLSEALTNALKHGDLSRPVELEEDWRDGYRLVVRNRVPHLPPGAPRPLGTGHGVTGMRERVELAGGRFVVVAEGDVWTVTATLPRRGG
jgi:signal transduction histidine kinase